MILVLLRQILELVVYFLNLCVVHLISDIPNNFHEDPIRRSTIKLKLPDTCNKPPPFLKNLKINQNLINNKIRIQFS